MNVEGMFRGWNFSRSKHTITSKDGKHCLWVCNGFLHFSDYTSTYNNAEPLLDGLNIFERWKVWREYKREKRRRSLENINKLTEGDNG